MGTIEPGKFANLILLKKSPLESVDAYDSMVSVWVHGRPVSRNGLAANFSKQSRASISRVSFDLGCPYGAQGAASLLSEGGIQRIGKGSKGDPFR